MSEQIKILKPRILKKKSEDNSVDTISIENQIDHNAMDNFPVWGNMSVKKRISYVCSAPFGVGDTSVDTSFYRTFAPLGAKDNSAYTAFFQHSASYELKRKTNLTNNQFYA